MNFLVQERSLDNNTSLDITDQNTLPPKHEESTKVYTNCTSIVPPSSFVSFSTSQFGENTLPSDDVTLIPVLVDSNSDIFGIGLLIAL